MEINELMRKWLNAFLADLDTRVDGPTRRLLMETCGRACARHHESTEIVRAIQEKSRDIDDFLEKLNQHQDLWCGKWIKQGDIIYSVCEECGCPLVLAGFVKPSPTFCECSRGWVKAVFETALGKPVKVELEQAIGRGDHVCKFIIQI